MVHSEEYKKYVLADLERSAGLVRPVAAGFWERLLVRRARVELLHPNPEDEFSQPAIGPNYNIVLKYRSMYAKNAPFTEDVPKPEALTVQKMRPSGYMLLNGHHRWLAGIAMHRRSLPIRIVNITPESEILAALERSKGSVCVSLDLDEVILAPKGASAEPKPRGLLPRPAVREGVPALIDALRQMGCDIWVYTGQYISEKDAQRILRPYGVRADGVVSGMKGGRSSGKLKERFRQRYRASVHVDASAVICVNTAEKTYEVIPLEKGAAMWASEAVAAVRGAAARYL